MAQIIVKLREAMLAYKRRTGERMTYEILAQRTGLAVGTLQNMGSRPHYNASLATLARICKALDASPGDMLELIDEPPKPKSKPKRAQKKK
ncbi:MAG: helix-turn-helix transcriptional regulator [Phycisphaerae bacterium]|jgi:DNA-binding Xre family transcriptional regulator